MATSNKPIKKFVKLAELDKTKGWLDPERNAVIPFEKLSESQLREAIIATEKNHLKFFNKAYFFGELLDKLMAEADKRGINDVTHDNTEFALNNAKKYDKK